MNTQTILALVLIAMSLKATYAQEKKLLDYPQKEAIALLEAGGTELIKKHGEEMLELIYLKEMPTDEEYMNRSLAERSRINQKQNLPVFKALKSGGETSLELIIKTHYFTFPRPLCDIEVIAFFLLDLKGQKEAMHIAENQMAGKWGYEKDNWQTVLDLLKDDDFSRGIYFYQKIPDIGKETFRIEKLKNQMKEQLKNLKESEHSSFFENHYRFQKILLALLKYYSSEKSWPNSLYLLAEKKLIELPEINFMDTEGYAHLPKLLGRLKEGNDAQKVLWLAVPDAKYTLEGTLDGSIKIIPTQPNH